MKFGRGYAVTVALVGAGLALFAASRVWKGGRTADVALSASGQTGGDLIPWLPALALAALAGAGAVLATQGLLRHVVGVLLAVFGVAILGAGVFGMANGASAWWYPSITMVGGVLVAGTGAVTSVHSGGWPGMGARYQREVPDSVLNAAAVNVPAAVEGADGGNRPPPPGSPASVAMWDALDRGEDPTQ